ncbi:MAG: hypothetical protein GY765_14415 [bacterium]|nr:hypothetical protein [bacterium]
MNKKKIITLVVILTALLFLAIVFLVYNLILVSNDMEKEVTEKAGNEGKRVATQLEREFAAVMVTANRFADKVAAGKIPREDLKSHLEQVLDKNPDIFGFGIAFQPNADTPGTPLFAPYYVRTETGLEYRPVQNYYDYTTRKDECKWYYQTLERQTADWSEPYMGKASGTLLAEYTIPLYAPGDKNKEKPLGVLFINYSLEGLKKLMHSLDLGKSGYGFMLSREGTFLAHPRKDYVDQQIKFQSTLYKLKKSERDKISNAIRNLKKGKGGVIEIDSHVTGETLLMFFHNIPSTGWPLIAVFMKHDMPLDQEAFNHGMLWIIIMGIFFFAMLFFLVYRVYEGEVHSFWHLSILVSLLLCLGIGLIWNMDLTEGRQKENAGTKIFDHTELMDFLRENSTGEPICIPTGVFIQSLEFASSNNVSLSGYIWQKYVDDLPKDISRAFILPEAIDSKIEKVYERKIENGVTIGWYFEATLRQPFDYSKYPLDQKNIWVRFWHKNFDRNVVLVPDLESYNLINPSSLPGIESDIVLSGLNIRQTFFSFVPKSYNTNFGIEKYEGQANFPELYFTIMVTRNFVDPFIGYLMPAIVVAGIIFSLFLIITGDTERTEKFAYNLSFILGASTGLFFSVLVAHSQLRNSLQLSEIVYLEYFYIVLYVMIILLSVNSFLFSLGKEIKFLEYRDNLIPKLLYWPFVLTVLFIITVNSLLN